MIARTRRRFLGLVALGAGGLALGAGRAGGAAKTAAARAYRRLVELPIDQPMGPLEAPALGALMAATFLLLGRELDEARYEDFFRWKAEHAPGYRGLYAAFGATADDAARRLGGAAFAEAPPSVQRAVLAKARAVREMINADAPARGLWLTLLDREWLLYERYLVRELLTLFARTDAWRLVGYGEPPGVPRTVEAYTTLPAGAEATP